MIRISLPYIFQLAQNLEPLGSLQEEENVYLKDIFIPLYSAKSFLENFLQNSLYGSSIRSSLTLGHNLIGSIDDMISPEDAWTSPIPTYKLFSVKHTYEQYKVALVAELGIMPSYFVLPKGGFDTNALLETGWMIFPGIVQAKVPEAIFDLNEAGKALAFDMPTACGYHLFRATESVLRKYYSVVTGGQSHPKVRNIAVYINAMKQNKLGDIKILAALDQLSKLHRNPLIHPEAALSLDEAIAAIGMARSVVTAMLVSIPDQEKTTTNPPPQ